MKQIILIFLVLSLLSALSACGKQTNLDHDSKLPDSSVANSDSEIVPNDTLPNDTLPDEANSSQDVASSVGSQEGDESLNHIVSEPPPTEGAIEKQFELNLVDIDGNAMEGAMTFTIHLPESWEAKGNEIFMDERKIADIHSGILNDQSNAFEKLSSQYVDAVATGELSVGSYWGQFYHMQSEISVSGVTAIKNEIVYCLSVDDKIVTIIFYPSSGTGIKTQREEFEAVLNSIE